MQRSELEDNHYNGNDVLPSSLDCYKRLLPVRAMELDIGERGDQQSTAPKFIVMNADSPVLSRETDMEQD